MIRQLSSLALAAALAAPGAYAQRTRGSEVDLEKRTKLVESTEPSKELVQRLARSVRPVRSANGGSGRAAGALPPGPGVVQASFYEGGVESFYVLTEIVPIGTKLKFVMTFTGDEGIDLGTREVLSDLYPGQWLRLPAINIFNRFWRQQFTTFNVVATAPDGSQSVSKYDFPAAGTLRNVTGVQNLLPGIDSWREVFGDDGSITAEIKGRFLTDSSVKTYVAFNGYVAPASAIQVVDANTMRVDLRAIYYYEWDDQSQSMVKYSAPLELMLEFILTVSQDGWSDNMPFRHTPR